MNMLKSRKLTIALFVIYLVVLSSVVLLKNQIAFRFLGMMFTFVDPNTQRSINLIPFGAMLFLNGSPAYAEIILNAMVFLPFGAFVCMLSKKKTLICLIAPIVLVSLFFEVAQYVFALGASDITDVIANTFGGIIGVLSFFLVRKVCKEKTVQVVNVLGLIVVAVFVLLLSMVRPF